MGRNLQLYNAIIPPKLIWWTSFQNLSNILVSMTSVGSFPIWEHMQSWALCYYHFQHLTFFCILETPDLCILSSLKLWISPSPFDALIYPVLALPVKLPWDTRVQLFYKFLILRNRPKDSPVLYVFLILFKSTKEKDRWFYNFLLMADNNL